MLGIVSNPGSRRNRRNPAVIHKIGRIAGELGEGVLARTTPSLEAVDEVAREFRDRGVDILALNGGDGTNHATLTRFVRAYGTDPLPRVLLMRGGTMNTAAAAMGLRRGRPVTVMRRLVSALREEREIEEASFDLLRVEADDRPAEYGFIFGNGLIEAFLSEYYAYRDPSPLVAAHMLARAGFSALFRGQLWERLFGRTSARATIDGKAWRAGDWLALGVATVPEIGLGFRPWFRVGEQPGTFHALGLACSPLRLLFSLPTIRLGLPPAVPTVVDNVGGEMLIELDRPAGYTIDGDMFGPVRRVRLSVGPRLSILRP